jgi:hypothetical protein
VNDLYNARLSLIGERVLQTTLLFKNIDNRQVWVIVGGQVTGIKLRLDDGDDSNNSAYI